MLPLGHILLGRQFGPSDAPTDSSCESECAKWIDLGLVRITLDRLALRFWFLFHTESIDDQTCSTEDLKCLCTEEYTASVKTCADCYLATPDATTEEKAPLAEAYNGYISSQPSSRYQSCVQNRALI